MTILLLGGTSEGRALAEALHAGGHDAITSLAGATRDRAELPGRVRIGGFGGEENFRQFLKDQRIDRIIDATHPFAAQMSHRAANAAKALAIGYLQVLRPAWTPQAGDNWIDIGSETEVAAHAKAGQTVFAATGRQTLQRYAGLAGVRLICRQIDPPSEPFPFEGGEFLIGRPPFSRAEEIALFKLLGVDWLVTKNAGGDASRSKLDAARELSIPVLMVRRPKQPDAPKVATVDDTLDWLTCSP